ncbi:N-6 DNA methylase [Neisseria iguanae]|uniref:N-6 DNA methylase n=1 Tax=Neisseria iguanae TaxID=90242 RepID=UPI001FE7A64D|nr:N-6 DNA methylase [Neisseria iguanae]
MPIRKNGKAATTKYGKNIRNAILTAFPNLWLFWWRQFMYKRNKAILLMYYQLYMDLNLGNTANGQYFAPYHVCQLMSALVTQDLGEKLQTEKFVTILEPACGSSANLIAFAESVQSHGYTSAKHIAAVGVDIDALCVWMCYLQCQLYRIPAKIVHGNSLTHEFWSAWCTSDWVHGGYTQAMAERISDSKKEPATEAGTGAIRPKLLTLKEQLVLF